MDSAVNLMFEIYRIRGNCSRTARNLGSGVAGEAALEDCARLDDTLARVYRHLQHTLKDIPFADPTVQAQLAGFTLLKADVTANSPDDKALLARFGLFGPPGIIFFDAGGKEIDGLRVVGFQEAETFLRTLKRAS